eukprot:15309312-Ditylum_brightwellii.AAC.1
MTGDINLRFQNHHPSNTPAAIPTPKTTRRTTKFQTPTAKPQHPKPTPNQGTTKNQRNHKE